MTDNLAYATTHFALAGLLIWGALGEDGRKDFTESWRRYVVFLLLNFLDICLDIV